MFLVSNCENCDKKLVCKYVEAFKALKNNQHIMGAFHTEPFDAEIICRMFTPISNSIPTKLELKPERKCSIWTW